MSPKSLVPVRSRSEIPEFASDSELAEFWETHEATAELVEEMRTDRERQGLPRRGRRGLMNASGTHSRENGKTERTFNDILASEGIDPRTVRLARHTKPKTARADQPDPYSLWQSDPDLLNEFQMVQGRQRKPFGVGDLIASFIVTPAPGRETLFVGLYEVLGVSSQRLMIEDPIYKDWGRRWQYEIERDPRLAKYVGRLTVAWGPGYKAWVQHADRHDKTVVPLNGEGP